MVRHFTCIMKKTLKIGCILQGGIKEAYNAYQKYSSENGVEPKLPGLNYSTNQLFWISAAQTWCSVYRPGLNIFFFFA